MKEGGASPSHEVRGLIRRIRRIMAEKRDVEWAGTRVLLEAKNGEIGRLQERLATVVKRELVKRELVHEERPVSAFAATRSSSGGVARKAGPRTSVDHEDAAAVEGATTSP
jgi:hypothetical protein